MSHAQPGLCRWGVDTITPVDAKGRAFGNEAPFLGDKFANVRAARTLGTMTDVAEMTRATAKRVGGYAELGRRLGVSGRAVQNYAEGVRAPRPAIRERLEGLAAIVAGATITDTPNAAPRMAERASATSPAVPGTPALRARLAGRVAATAPSLEQVEALVADLDVLLAEALADGSASYRDRAAVAAAKTAALRSLAAMRGEGQITASQIIRSRPFKEAMRALDAALSNHPAAARDVADVLTRIEGG